MKRWAQPIVVAGFYSVQIWPQRCAAIGFTSSLYPLSIIIIIPLRHTDDDDFFHFSPQKFRCGMSWNFGCYFGNSPIARDDSMYSTTSLYKNDRRSSPLYVVRLFMTKRNLPWSMMCVDLHTHTHKLKRLMTRQNSPLLILISNPQLNGWTSHTHPSQFSNLVETLIVTLRVHFFRILKFQLNCCVAIWSFPRRFIRVQIYGRGCQSTSRSTRFESCQPI
jgi:hypothetical protein